MLIIDPHIKINKKTQTNQPRLKFGQPNYVSKV